MGNLLSVSIQYKGRGAATPRFFVLDVGLAAALLDWLAERDYQFDPRAEKIIDSYIEDEWAFVAVKLNPSEKRAYENEFLPPLTIRYQVDIKLFAFKNRGVADLLVEAGAEE
jgi:hypothetical protein